MDKARAQKEERQREIRRDSTLIVMLLVLFFLYASLLGFCGSVGEALGQILFGLFGKSAWGIPLWIFLFCLYLLNGTGGRLMPVRLAALAVLLLTVGGAFHLRMHAAHIFSLETAYDLQRVFSMCADRSDGGGIVGGSICWFLFRAFGFAGSILVYTALAVIGAIQLFQRSPAGIWREWRERRREAGVPDFAERRAQLRQRRLEEMEEREESRLEREAERILRREERLERLAGQDDGAGALPGLRTWAGEASGSAVLRRRRKADRGVPDLEHTRLGCVDRPAGAFSGTAGGRNRGNGSAASAVQSGRRRDVHEITIPGLEEETGAARSADRRAGGEAVTVFGEASVYRAGGPEPEGTTYRRSGSFADPKADPRRRTGASPLVLAPASPAGFSSAPVSSDEEQDAFGQVGTSDSLVGTSDSLHGTSYDLRGTEEGNRGAIAQSTADRSSAEKGVAEKSAAEQGAEEKGSAAEAVISPDGSISGDRQPGSGRTVYTEPTEEDLSGISVHREKEAGSGTRRGAGRTAAAKKGGSYVHPPFDLLTRGSGGRSEETERELQETAYRLQETLRTFGVQVTITDISQGPSVTRYELKPDQGVKVSKIVSLADDIKLRLAATDIRIEAPIPGKSAIGIEVPNKHETTVHLRELLETKAFRRFDGKLPFAVGKDIGGKTIIADIARMPHILIAGATGSGKSVCINTIILSILYRTSPEDVRLLMIDPKVVELSVYKGIPHLIIPVVTDARKASAALNWAVAEMEKRYRLFAAAGVRDLNGYNSMAREWLGEDGEPEREPLPRLVIIVDELADLMMVARNEVESAICRLAQLARAAGIHLIIATQRPSVDVITGLIKANMPSRIAFAVSSQVDSRTILDMAGAEKLIGRGDMLFYPQNYQKPARMQGAFVSDDEVIKVVEYIRGNNKADLHDPDIDRQIDDIAVNGMPDPEAAELKNSPSRDEYFADAGRFIIEKNKASIGLLQRVFKIGFNRAARIMDQLAEAGVVSEESSTRARQVLMSLPEFEEYLETERQTDY